METPFEERVCAFCGDIFIAHHGHQRYCPEKYGRVNHCKHEQKARVSENRLAEKAMELAKIGMAVYEQTPYDKNLSALRHIMGYEKEKIVTDYLLDELGFDILYFSSKAKDPFSNHYTATIGEFDIAWIAKNNNRLTFKITRK
jgi:hypothetical protein